MKSNRTYARSSLLLATLALAPHLCAQNITEIIDETGDGLGNELEGGQGVAVDLAGNVYVSGYDSDNAFKISPDGVITEIIDKEGDGGGGWPSDLWYALDVAVHPLGTAYVIGAESDNVFRITPDGVILEICSEDGDGAGNILRYPFAVDVDDAGNAFVCGLQSHNVLRITPDGTVTEVCDPTAGGIGAGLQCPRDLCHDADGNVYVIGTCSDNVLKISPTGRIAQILGHEGGGPGNELSAPFCVAVDGEGNVYVNTTVDNGVLKIMPGGTVTRIIDSSGDGVGHTLSGPTALATDGANNVYVAGIASNNVFKITPEGQITQIIDGTGDGGGNYFQKPFRIAANLAGDVYVTGRDSNNAFEIAAPPGEGFCFGDPGSGTPCPCDNDNDSSVPGSGCDNGVFASGAQLRAFGEASVNADTLMLGATHLEPNNAGLYFQGNVDLSPGAVFGDGLLCTGYGVIRLQTRTADAAGNSNTTIPIALKGGVNPGDTKFYQLWYRTVAFPPCGYGVNDFNTTNGYRIVWRP
jgi:hypothetical protein